jgi:enoyl-CoA hydratase
MAYKLVQTEVHDRAGLVRLNRPEALNALNRALMDELAHALEAFDADPEIGAIVLTGDEKAFAAGADIKRMVNASPIEMYMDPPIGDFDRIRAIRKPLIAAVSGWCLGGGNEIALTCDMIVASENAKFGQPEVEIGIIPGAGGTQRLTRAVGKALAMEMVLNNRTLTAQEALQFGLVNRVVPVELYLEEALSLANEIAARAPLAVRIGKEMVNYAFESFLKDGVAAERRALHFLFSSEDQQEGMRAFIEKRDAKWTGT